MSAVDLQAVGKLQKDLGGEKAVFLELLEVFLSEADRLVATMEGALGPRDARSLYRASHSLKSTAGTFGAGRLAELCRGLEADAENAFPPDAAARVAAVRAEWDRARGELAKLRAV